MPVLPTAYARLSLAPLLMQALLIPRVKVLVRAAVNRLHTVSPDLPLSLKAVFCPSLVSIFVDWAVAEDGFQSADRAASGCRG